MRNDQNGESLEAINESLSIIYYKNKLEIFFHKNKIFIKCIYIYVFLFY